jgi:hypothetical protein
VFTRTAARFLSALLALSIPLNNAVRAGDQYQHLNSPCNIHLAYLGAKYDPVREYAYDTPPQAAHEAASRQLEPTISTHIVAPTTTDEFARMFGREPSSSEVNDMNAFQVKAKASLTQATRMHQLMASDFEAILKESKSSFEILVGHNDGGSFKFPDGSAMDLADMLGTAWKYGKQLIVVSCKAVQNSGVNDVLGTTREITYPEGLFIAEALAQSIQRTTGGLSVASVREQLTEIEKKAVFKFNVKYLVLRICGAAAAGIVIALVIYILDDERKKRHTPSSRASGIKPIDQNILSIHQVFSSRVQMQF